MKYIVKLEVIRTKFVVIEGPDDLSPAQVEEFATNNTSFVDEGEWEDEQYLEMVGTSNKPWWSDEALEECEVLTYEP